MLGAKAHFDSFQHCNKMNKTGKQRTMIMPTALEMEDMSKLTPLNAGEIIKFTDLPLHKPMVVEGAYWKQTRAAPFKALVLQIQDWKDTNYNQEVYKPDASIHIVEVWALSTYANLFSEKLDQHYDKMSYLSGENDQSLDKNRLRFPHLLMCKQKSNGYYTFDVANFDLWREYDRGNDEPDTHTNGFGSWRTPGGMEACDSSPARKKRRDDDETSVGSRKNRL